MSGSKDIAIKVSHISKNFKLPHESQNSLKGRLINFSKRGYEMQEALKDVSFEVEKGEFFGIVGRNGSGKSTLLKILAGIYTPTSGEVTVNGKLTPFIELGVGFNPELSGRDNVFLNGALLGFSRKEVAAMYSGIVEFAGLERFMDQKLKNYSSGMQVRLAFSIAIRANTDILVLDEVLAVGDEAFQRKCYDYFNELKEAGKTVILVTHDMSAVKRFCTQAVVIDRGKMLYQGDSDGAIEVYRSLNLDGSRETLSKSNKRRQKHTTSILAVTTIGKNGDEQVIFQPEEKIRIKATVKIPDDMAEPVIQFWFNNPGGTSIASIKIRKKDIKKFTKNIYGKLDVSWALDGIFNDGKYLVTAEISDEVTGDIREVLKEVHEFDVFGWESPYVIVHPPKDIDVKEV